MDWFKHCVSLSGNCSYRLEFVFAARADPLERLRQPLVVVVELQRQLRLRADLALQHRVRLVAGDSDQAVALEVKVRAAAVETEVAAARFGPIRGAVVA